jgi:hypothetical protein
MGACAVLDAVGGVIGSRHYGTGMLNQVGILECRALSFMNSFRALQACFRGGRQLPSRLSLNFDCAISIEPSIA